jgi:hypothetical protein
VGEREREKRRIDYNRYQAGIACPAKREVRSGFNKVVNNLNINQPVK